MKRKKNAHFFEPALAFLLPGLVGFSVFYIWPFFISLGYSLLDKPVNGTFVGWKNYIALLASEPYRLGLRNTLFFIALCLPLNMLLSLLAAMLLRKTGRHRALFTLILLIPLVIPSGSMIFFWRILFEDTGFLNGLRHWLALPEVRFLNSSWSLGVITLIFLWKNMGYNVILFLAGLSGIPAEYYEAAKVDGAGSLRCFRQITLPFLAPTLVLVTIMSLINSFKVFKEIYLLTGQYPHESVYMLQHFMNNMFGSLQYPRLTTATTLLVLGIGLLTQGLLRLERRFDP